VSRYGGEEFLVVLNGCRTRVGASRAEKYSARYPGDAVKTATGPVAVPTSLGVAGTEDWLGSHAEQLIHQRVKECGRNHSVLAKPSGLQEIRMSNLAEDNVPAR
jgi:GGDEF domain-containing protein